MTEPKFQFSIFDKHQGYDGQWVVRGDDWNEFMENRNLVMEQLANAPAAPVGPATTVEATENGYPCPQCKSPTVFKSGVSKAGKPWRGYFCTANKDHVSWLK